MLRSVKDMTGYPIEAIDGNIGSVEDLLFDDDYWILRYVAAETGNWLPGKKVLISALHFLKPEVGFKDNHFCVDLQKERIEQCPSLDSNAPISRQYEEEFARYYDQSMYWDGALALGASMIPPYDVPPVRANEEQGELIKDVRHRNRIEEIQDSHLRSSNEIIGYTIDCSDDEFGHVEDLIIDDETWKVHHVVVDSRNWLPGRKFLIDVSWVDAFEWANRKASVSLTRREIENSPEFDPRRPVNSDYLENLYDYYGRPYEKPKFF